MQQFTDADYAAAHATNTKWAKWEAERAERDAEVKARKAALTQYMRKLRRSKGTLAMPAATLEALLCVIWCDGPAAAQWYFKEGEEEGDDRWPAYLDPLDWLDDDGVPYERF